MTATLDADGLFRVWAPNRDDNRWNLTHNLAFLVDWGLRKPRPLSPPHWTDTTDDGVTVIVRLHLGSRGEVRVDGEAISEAATVRLGWAGFKNLLDFAVETVAAGASDRTQGATN